MTYRWDSKDKTILVLGGDGLVGSALKLRLHQDPCHLVSATRDDADLTNAADTLALIESIKPDAIIIAAAKVGGILANRENPVDFLELNLLIQLNVLRAAHAVNVERVLLLGSSCIYPKYADQPISENSLMTGPLEPTNDAYAIAKIAGIRLIDGYRQQYGHHWISAMPTNLYGPNDNFDLQSSHVLPAVIRKFHDAKTKGQANVEIWGTGQARREFLYVEDCADALLHLLKTYDDTGPINVGSGTDITILALAEMIKVETEFKGGITHDLSKPDGTPAKLMDNTRLSALGWTPKVDLRKGIKLTHQWFLQNHS
jgi:GDP-L-fucose synthase